MQEIRGSDQAESSIEGQHLRVAVPVEGTVPEAACPGLMADGAGEIHAGSGDGPARPTPPASDAAGADGTAAGDAAAARTNTSPRKLHYGTTGASYMAVIEFRSEGVKAASYLHYGQSHDPASPHFFDQAKLLSERRFKPAWFEWDDVVAHTVRAYHPGEAPLPKASVRGKS